MPKPTTKAIRQQAKTVIATALIENEEYQQEQMVIDWGFDEPEYDPYDHDDDYMNYSDTEQQYDEYYDHGYDDYWWNDLYEV